MNRDNGSGKRVFDNAPPGGGRVDLSKVNPQNIEYFGELRKAQERGELPKSLMAGCSSSSASSSKEKKSK
uniref:Uncharacterized protein n=1 Tax=Wolbachia endosymbiont of Aleurodicus floccissimus TaxID=2152762 RepID=A0A3B0JGL0_9RICK